MINFEKNRRFRRKRGKRKHFDKKSASRGARYEWQRPLSEPQEPQDGVSGPSNHISDPGSQ